MVEINVSSHKVVLGTVQFGLDYGISNVSGRPALDEVGKILEVAKMAGIGTLDTAAGYGSSEEVLGLLASASDFNVITKTLPISAHRVDSNVIDQLCEIFDRSLARLRRDKVAGLLAHHSLDLLKPGADLLYRQLSDWKASGLVERIGVSVYSPAEADEILSRYQIDLIQLPFNVVDQRAARTGVLARLHQSGVEVHARSAFLQGALLMEPAMLPEHLLKLRPLMSRLKDACAERGWSVQEACLRFVIGTDCVDKVVCGVNSAKELEQLVSRVKSGQEGFDFSPYHVDDVRIIQPSEWPKSAT